VIDEIAFLRHLKVAFLHIKVESKRERKSLHAAEEKVSLRSFSFEAINKVL